ncbi:MAG: glycosyltransferase family 2 protein [Chitinophagaceae bacterium]|nr:glycosyltransferase family 2 protein [Chitinophagaceae bacterium]
MRALSVIIITFNEEKNIGRCIDSVKEIADEIVILDSYSTDNTLEVARNRGAVIFQQKFQGYGPQKNAALQLSSHDLVLSLDADEALSNTLIREIQTEKRISGHEAYMMNRCTNYCGKFIRHGSWYPDKKIRLFSKKIAKWNNEMIHERIEMLPDTRIKQLSGDILHYSFNSIAEHVAQNNKFSTISAETSFKNGRRTNLFKVIVHPSWAFLLSYILKLGFIDGFYGFIVAVNISHLTFMKHTKLMTLQRALKIKSG